MTTTWQIWSNLVSVENEKFIGTSDEVFNHLQNLHKECEGDYTFEDYDEEIHMYNSNDPAFDDEDGGLEPLAGAIVIGE